MIWLVEGRAVDHQGNATMWRWRTHDHEPRRLQPSDLLTLKVVVRKDFEATFGHLPSHVVTAVLPHAGEKLYKIPHWRQTVEGRWGIHVEERDEPL